MKRSRRAFKRSSHARDRTSTYREASCGLYGLMIIERAAVVQLEHRTPLSNRDQDESI